MISQKIIYVVENKRWVQSRRLIFLNKYQKKYNLKLVSANFFYFFWKIGFYRKYKIVFSTWRIVLGYIKRDNKIFKTTHYNNFLANITSHSNIGGGLDPLNPIPGSTPEVALERALKILRLFKVVTVNSKILHNQLSNFLPKLVYCPNGVEIKQFYQFRKKKFDPKKIIFGWVGKKRGPKNYKLLSQIKNMMPSNYFEFKEVLVDKNLKYIPKSQKQMLNFYNSIDFYLCVSLNEGTPNPALEAAACGVPIISTKVGNMPEIIIDKYNGYFIDPNLESIVKTLQQLRNTSIEEYNVMSNLITATIQDKWSWDKQIVNFEHSYDLLMK